MDAASRQRRLNQRAFKRRYATRDCALHKFQALKRLAKFNRRYAARPDNLAFRPHRYHYHIIES
jgi:hypothetical protein